MRIGILNLGNTSTINKATKTIVDVLEKKGHTVKIYTEELFLEQRLGINKHFIFLVYSGSLLKEGMAKQLSEILRKKGEIGVVNASLFVTKRLFITKKMLAMMKSLEKAGFIIHYTDILSDEQSNRSIFNSIDLEI